MLIIIFKQLCNILVNGLSVLFVHFDKASALLRNVTRYNALRVLLASIKVLVLSIL